MTAHTYKVGDTVAVINTLGFIRKRTVKCVRTYKQRTKITLNDDSEWEQNGGAWSGHTYSAEHITPWSDEAQARLLNQQRRAAIDWVMKQWASLPEDVRAEIGDAARKARRAVL